MPPLLDAVRLPGHPPGGEFTIDLPETMRGLQLTALIVTWRDASGAAASATLPVQAQSAASLLPPEEFRNLSAAQIIDCLLSGRDVAEWAEEQEGRRRPSGVERTALDITEMADFATYRIRRLGRALAALGKRITETLRSRDAMEYRLRHDPFGPRKLANALHAQEPRYDFLLSFAFAEIALLTAHAGRRVRAERLSGEPDLREIYRHIVCEILDEATAAKGLPENLSAYLSSVRAECATLLGIQKGDGNRAR